jgi:hypothetical protein
MVRADEAGPDGVGDLVVILSVVLVIVGVVMTRRWVNGKTLEGGRG